MLNFISESEILLVPSISRKEKGGVLSLSVSLEAGGDPLPQNEGAPDGPVSFLLSLSSPHVFLGSPMVSVNASLMNSSLLILVVVFFLCVPVCLRVYLRVYIHVCGRVRTLHSPYLLGIAILPGTRQNSVSFKLV